MHDHASYPAAAGEAQRLAAHCSKKMGVRIYNMLQQCFWVVGDIIV